MGRGRPRKDAGVGGNASPLMNGSLDSLKASTAIAKASSLRRSGRIKSRNLLAIEPQKDILPSPEPNNEVSPNLEEILANLAPNEESLSNQVPTNEGPNNLSNPVANKETDVAPSEPSETLHIARIESKIDFLVESVKEFQHEGVKRASPDVTSPAQELSYKSMYFESQRKIQEMEEEIRELSKDYEISQAKVDMLQEINANLRDMNNMSVVNNFGKATEAIVSLAAQGKLNVPEEGGNNPALPHQIVAAGQNREASPPAPTRRGPKRTR